MRRLSPALVLTAVVLTGCGGGDEPALIGPNAIDGELAAIEDFEPEPAPPCGTESNSVLSDVKADRFGAWNRTVNGHREQVVVGIWPLGKDDATRQIEVFARDNATCRASDAAADYLIETMSDGEPSEGFLMTSFDEEHPVHIDRIYTWYEGYMVTVWLQSLDNRQTTKDMRAILEAQRMELRAE
jgi:hypothetical protein